MIQSLPCRDEMILRRLLASAYCPKGLYCDDGELQDNTAFPCIDFKRDSPDQIRAKMEDRSLATLALFRKMFSEAP